MTMPTDALYEPNVMRTFSAAVESEDLRVRVIVEVEAKKLGADVFEVSEVTGMFAARVFKSGERTEGEAPFAHQVPF